MQISSGRHRATHLDGLDELRRARMPHLLQEVLECERSRRGDELFVVPHGCRAAKHGRPAQTRRDTQVDGFEWLTVGFLTSFFFRSVYRYSSSCAWSSRSGEPAGRSLYGNTAGVWISYGEFKMTTRWRTHRTYLVSRHSDEEGRSARVRRITGRLRTTKYFLSSERRYVFPAEQLLYDTHT